MGRGGEKRRRRGGRRGVGWRGTKKEERMAGKITLPNY